MRFSPSRSGTRRPHPPPVGPRPGRSGRSCERSFPYNKPVTLLRISDPSLLDLLCADLRSRGDIIAEVVGEDMLQVDILGSYGVEGMRMATALRLRAWEEAQRAQGVDVHVEIID